MVTRTTLTTVPAGGDTWVMLPITGASEVTTSGPHTVDVVIRETGTSTWTANAELVASYFPFGGAGGDILSAASTAPQEGAGTVPRRP
jgi:hypothetical protein